MSSMILNGDTSGAITVTVPAVAGTNTVTIPAAAGTVMVSGNMPAFSVYNSTAQAITSAAVTKLTFDTKTGTNAFDTASAWSTANNRFTPQVAGYYQFIGSVSFNGGISAAEQFVLIRRNGSDYTYPMDLIGTTLYIISGSTIMYLNGSTDYVELFTAQYSGTSKNTVNASTSTYFAGFLVRAA